MTGYLDADSRFRHAKMCMSSAGLTVGTHIMTLTGEEQIENLRSGDRVLTKNYGVQTLMNIQFEDVDLIQRPDQAPVCIPPDTFGSDRDAAALYLAPDQKIALRHMMFDLFFGSREIVVRAADLVGQLEISQIKDLKSITYVALGFHRQHMIYCGNFAVDLSQQSKLPHLSAEQARLACSLFQTHMQPQTAAGFPLH